MIFEINKWGFGIGNFWIVWIDLWESGFKRYGLSFSYYRDKKDKRNYYQIAVGYGKIISYIIE